MAMTSAVKDELSRVEVSRQTARRAEVATMLRFAGALHLVAGHIVIEAELDTGSVARRLKKEIAEVYGHASDISIVTAGGLRKSNRYIVRVTRDGEGLARQAGLVVDSYEDEAVAEMGRVGPGKVAIVKITLRPRIAFAGAAPEQAVLDRLHHEAHARCFIANTLNCPIVIEG